MGQMGPKRAKNEVFGQFLKQNALDFADIADFDRELWNLATSGGQSAEEKCFCHFLDGKGSERVPPGVDPVAQFGFWSFSRVWYIRLTSYCIFR